MTTLQRHRRSDTFQAEGHRGRRPTAITVLVLLCLALTAPTASTAGRDELTVLQGTEITTLDPQHAVGADSMGLVRHLFNGLVFLDARGAIVPDLAERWELANDQVTWTFHLRRGVKFHDGSPFNAEAVRFTIDRAIGPRSVPSPARTYLSVVDRVEVLNDATVRIVTKGPSGPFLANLAHVSAGAMLSPSAMEKAGRSAGREPVGTGPFRLAEWRRSDRLVLERNETYFGDKARVQRLVYRAVPEASARARQLETGDADVAVRLPPLEAKRMSATAGVEVLRTVSIRPMMFYLNTRKKPFNDLRVRRAINMAIDRQELIQTVLSGEATPLDSLLAPGLPGYIHVQSPIYDPARARELLNQRGVSDAGRITMDCPQGRFLLDREVCAAVAAQLGRVGLNVQTRIFADYAQYVASRAKRDYDMTMLAFAPASLDADGTFQSTVRSANAGETFNWADFSNVRVDALIDAGRATADEGKRREIYAQLQKMVMHDQPTLLLYNEHDLTGIRKGVTGVVVRPDQAVLFLKAAVP
jgi:peptide/nickel transport system substrate-binding protein